MFVITVIVSVLYAGLVAFSAVGKVTGNEQVLASTDTVGVPRDKVALLAAPLGAGALGLLVGLFWAPIGIAAAIGLFLYFALALGAHLRVKDTRALRPRRCSWCSPSWSWCCAASPPEPALRSRPSEAGERLPQHVEHAVGVVDPVGACSASSRP